MDEQNLKKLLNYKTYTPTYKNFTPAAFPWMGHVIFADLLVRELHPGLFVELGTFYGVSFFAFCQAIAESKLNTRCYAIDSWEGDPQAGFYGEEVYNCVKKHCDEHYSSFTTLLRKYFDDALDLFADSSIDILHIDGLHTYEAVKHDFETWLPKVKPGGIILFHDICEIHNGFSAYKVWEEIVPLTEESYRFTHSHGLGVWRKPGGEPLESSLLAGLFSPKDTDAELIDMLLSNIAEKQNFSAQLLHAQLLCSQQNQKNQAVQQELANARNENQKLAQRLLTAEQNNHILLAQCNDLISKNRKFVYQNGQLNRENQPENERWRQLDTILSSRSWKITAPLRYVGNTVRYSNVWQLFKKFVQTCKNEGGVAAIKRTVRYFTLLPPNNRESGFSFDGDSIANSSGKDTAQTVAAPVIPYEKEVLCSLGNISVKSIAFYLPQFHSFPENDQWWGKGFTEWTNVKRSLPSFTGHCQPEEPHDSLGYYNLLDPEVMRRQAEMAKQHGIYGFCFHHYWFSGKRLMEKPVDQLLAHPEIDMPFCLNWANENWTRRWDGQDKEILIAQQHSPEDDIAFWNDLLRYFRDPRYIRVEGRPVFLVYHARLLPDMQETLVRWRQWCILHHEVLPYFVMVQSFDNTDPCEYGFDAAVQFPPHRVGDVFPNYQVVGLAPDFSGGLFDYEKTAQSMLRKLKSPFPTFPCVFPSWDNTPRRLKKAAVYLGSTPERYETWLARACTFVQEHLPEDRRFVFINAWNEWAEGAHLEPSKAYGFAYLNATTRALKSVSHSVPDFPIDEKHSLKVLFIGHDAALAGAQRLLLDLISWLKQHTSVDCRLLLLNGGTLQQDYEKVIATRVCRPNQINADEMAAFCNGIPDVICGNTAVSASAYLALSKWQVPIVSCVNELESSLQKYATPELVETLAQHSSKIIGASAPVCCNLIEQHNVDPAKCSIINSYTAITISPVSREKKAQLKQQLGIPDDRPLVLGCGTQSYRKGIDLFLDVASIVETAETGSPQTTFCWIGAPDDTIPAGIAERSSRLNNLLLPGELKNLAPYFQAADVFLLPSREDPFPLVCLLAAQSETPVICFAESGGMPEFVGQDAGFVVPYLDTETMAKKCLELLRDSATRTQLGRQGRKKFLEQHSTDAAVPRMLHILREVAGKPHPVSVILPNYNYAVYLDSRIESILRQRYRDVELIFLDDSSSDASTDILKQWQGLMGARLVLNAENSGNVWKQWQKGLELAKGQYIWIAEADDLCDEDFLSTLLSHLQPKTALAYCIPDVIDQNGNAVALDYRSNYLSFASHDRWSRSYSVEGVEEVNAALSIVNTIPNVSAAIFRKPADMQAILEAQKFRCAGDWMFYLKLAESGQIAYVHEAHAKHRRHMRSVIAQEQNRKAVILAGEIKTIHDYAKQKYQLSNDVLQKMTVFEASLNN